jgi:threonine dehydratase
VVCVLSGSNNDIARTEEIKERSLLYEGLKHYFVINFAQRPGALREFVNNVLGENDDITFFEYYKKNNRDKGPAVVGIEQKEKGGLDGLLERLEKSNFTYQYLNNNDEFFHLIV